MTLTIHDKRPQKGMFQAIKESARNTTIEECAQRVDQMARSVTTDDAIILTAAAEVIRALKSKDGC